MGTVLLRINRFIVSIKDTEDDFLVKQIIHQTYRQTQLQTEQTLRQINRQTNINVIKGNSQAE